MKFKLLISFLLIITTLSEARVKKGLEFASLEKDYNNLILDDKFKPYAKTEKQMAKNAVEDLINNKIKKKLRPQALYMATHKIAYARLVAESEWIVRELELEVESARDYELKITKAEAQIARHDAEISRMMLIAQQEESRRSEERANQAEMIAQNSLAQAEQLRKETAAAKKYAKAQAQEASLAKQEAELAFQETEALRKKLDSIATEQTDKGLMMTLGDFMFDSGKTTIKQGAVENFSKVVDFINTYPNNKVSIEGHTDSSGSNQLNLKLSQKRADAVKKLLIKYGIKETRIEALGMGEELPIADNSTQSGKAKNRRVEIIILQ